MRVFAFRQGRSILTLEAVMRKNHLMVVIHVLSATQALKNAEIAFDNGADGVFLISHTPRVNNAELMGAEVLLRHSLGPNKFIGLNFLSVNPFEAIELISNLSNASALWVDDVGYAETDDFLVDPVQVPRKIWEHMRRLHESALLFGGVAFKYRPEVKDVGLAAKLVSSYVDVVTTSGPATEEPPTMEKIVAMREAVPEGKLANASGLSPENVSPYLPHLDYILAATSLNHRGTDNLDAVRVRQMADLMHS